MDIPFFKVLIYDSDRTWIATDSTWSLTLHNHLINFSHRNTCRKVKSESEVTQSCPTLRNSMDCSLPGSSVHGIFQARVLEWGAIAFSVEIYRVVYYCDSQFLENMYFNPQLEKVSLQRQPIYVYVSLLKKLVLKYRVI